jgi:hypothetical protein
MKDDQAHMLKRDRLAVRHLNLSWNLSIGG